MNERLKEIRKHLNMNQTEFANLLGIGQSTLAMMEVSKRDISERHIKTISAICGVNEQWLRTGEGDMFVDDGDDFLSELFRKYSLTSSQQNIVRAVYELPPEYQDMLLALAHRLVAENEETDHERAERIVNRRLDEYEDEQARLEENKQA